MTRVSPANESENRIRDAESEETSPTLAVVPTFTVVVAHFGDPFWINQLLDRLCRQSQKELITKIVVIDQDRTSEYIKLLIPEDAPPVEVVSFPIDREAVEQFGHDHGPSLNRALRSNVTSSHCIVVDSDIVLMNCSALNNIVSLLSTSECVMAREPRMWGLSHPCFMVFPSDLVTKLDFTQGQTETGIDTGRLVALQVAQLGRKLVLLPQVRAFNGTRGYLFLDSSVLHFGSGSFASSTDARLLKQVDVRRMNLYRSCVAEEPPRAFLHFHERLRLRTYKLGSRSSRLLNRLRHVSADSSSKHV